MYSCIADSTRNGRTTPKFFLLLQRLFVLKTCLSNWIPVNRKPICLYRDNKTWSYVVHMFTRYFLRYQLYAVLVKNYCLQSSLCLSCASVVVDPLKISYAVTRVPRGWTTGLCLPGNISFHFVYDDNDSVLIIFD